MKSVLCVLTSLVMFTSGSSMALAADPSSGVPDQQAITREVNEGVSDVLGGRAPKWIIRYTGDLEGSIQGGIMTAMSISSSTIAVGNAMNEARTGSAPQSMQLRVMTGTDPLIGTMQFRLADGTKCNEIMSAGKFSRVKIIDDNAKTFHAEASGSLACGAAKNQKIDYTATLNKKP